MKKFKAVCSVNSAYGLFLYFLITGNNIEETFFICSDDIPFQYRLKFKNNSYHFKCKQYKSSIIPYLYQIYSFVFLPFFFRYKGLTGLSVYGFDNLPWSNSILKYCKEFYLIEDGVSNYLNPPIVKNKFLNSIWRKFLITNFKNTFFIPWGFSNKVKKIYLTGILPTPKEIQNKVEIEDLFQRWNNLDQNKKNMIIEFFTEGIKSNASINRKVLLLTQCFSESKFITEEEKINIYKYIIEYYGAENVIIKTHPREKTDYKLIFPKVEVINEPVPFQLITLLYNIKFDNIVTINSAAAYYFNSNVKKLIIVPTLFPHKNRYEFIMDKCKQVLK